MVLVMKNKRPQNKHTEYLIERDGKQYGAYKDWATAKKIADALVGYVVIRHGDEKVWESL